MYGYKYRSTDKQREQLSDKYADKHEHVSNTCPLLIQKITELKTFTVMPFQGSKYTMLFHGVLVATTLTYQLLSFLLSHFAQHSHDFTRKLSWELIVELKYFRRDMLRSDVQGVDTKYVTIISYVCTHSETCAFQRVSANTLHDLTTNLYMQ